MYYESRIMRASLLNTSLARSLLHYQTAVSVSKLPPGLPCALAAPVGWAALALGLPAPVAGLLALGTLVMLSGALHEDGLADTADGIWGGWTRQRRLEIMRDSRVGKTIVETVPTQILFPNDRATISDYDFLRVNAKEAALLVQPTIGQRIALVRSAGDSVFVDADLSALGNLLPILGGGATGEARVPADWRANPDFWRHVI